MKYAVLYLKINPKETIKPIIFSLVVSYLFLAWQLYDSKDVLYNHSLAIVSGDSAEYIASANNIIINGLFYPNGKLPGYALFLVPLFYFFKFNVALSLAVIIQTLFSAISVLFLSKLSFSLTNNTWVYNLVFYSYLLSSYVSVFNKSIYADSLSISLLIIMMYYLIYGIQHNNLKLLFFSGILFCVAVFLRPILIVFGVAFFIFSLIYFFNSKSKIIKYFLCFFIPFLVVDVCWISYNYNYYNDTHPLMSFKYYDKVSKNSYVIEEGKFIQSWGGDCVWWEPNSDILFFGVNRIKAQKNIVLPNYIYTSKYNQDSLTKLKSDIAEYELNKSPKGLQAIKTKFINYKNNFEQEKKMMHYASTFLIFKKFILNGYGAYNLFQKKFKDLPIYNKIIKLIFIGSYVLFGFIGFWILCVYGISFFKKVELLHLLAFYVMGSVFVLCFIYRFSEYRYFAPYYPFTLIFTNIYLFKLIKKQIRVN